MIETLKNGLGLCAIAIAALVLPATAAAAPVVPPENSAATQYTEAIPTGGGQKDAGKVGDRGKRSPASVLGSHRAKKLEAKGREGREVAEVVAATAPRSETAPAPDPESASKPVGEKAANGNDDEKKADGGAAKRKEPPNGPQSAAAEHRLDIPAGSSGLGEVLAQATGSSSTGELGGLLPLILLATIFWAIAFLLRQRRRAA